jgi:hypothetical protein
MGSFYKKGGISFALQVEADTMQYLQHNPAILRSFAVKA